MTWEQIEEYRTWTYERRLQWLMMGNLLRKSLPRKTIELQDAFRKGIIKRKIFPALLFKIISCLVQTVSKKHRRPR